MGNSILKTVVDPKPLAYSPPPFPSLYWPVPVSGAQTVYLYDAESMFRFTLYWTLVCVVAVHLAAAGYACCIQYRNWKVTWIVPIVYVVIGGAEALLAGNVVGGLLGGIYTAGYFKMSTWIPLTWGVINAMVLIIASFAIQGGL